MLGFVLVVIGCGPNYKARAVVRGKVTFAGKNLTTGDVMFHGPNGMTGMAAIKEDGSYEMMDAPLGEVKVTVSVPKVPPGGVSRMKVGMEKRADEVKSVDPTGSGRSITMGSIPKNIVPIPDKYGFIEQTPLTYTVVKGEQTHDIKLDP